MTEQRVIAVRDVAAGMHVKSEDRWWLVEQMVDNGDRTGTATLVARTATVEGKLGARARLIFLPVTRYGATVRVGCPAESSVGDGRALHRVVWRPRYRSDRMPYVDSNGDRWSRDDTAAYRSIQVLADAFAKQVTA